MEFNKEKSFKRGKCFLNLNIKNLTKEPIYF